MRFLLLRILFNSVLSSSSKQRRKKLDVLIANVQAQIGKPKAYKRGLITEVITKGLDPTVQMKDSDIE